jgi:hypothetical protein
MANAADAFPAFFATPRPRVETAITRALFGVEEVLNEAPEEASIAADLDLAPIRRAVAELLPSEEAGTPQPAPQPLRGPHRAETW